MAVPAPQPATFVASDVRKTIFDLCDAITNECQRLKEPAPKPPRKKKASA